MYAVATQHDHHPLLAAAATGRRPSKVGIELLGFQQYHHNLYTHQQPHNDFHNIVERIKRGLSRHAPELCGEGVGGTYFLKDDSSKIIAVFKPADEEAHAINNPKQNLTDSDSSDAESRDDRRSPKKGLKVGEGVMKECAAYLLDKNGFAGVPATFLVKCAHWAFHQFDEPTLDPNSDSLEPPPGKRLKLKVGSLQQYVEHDCASWDISPSRFPVNEVHRIGVLDIRMLNLDRHGGNILVKHRDGFTKLVPIDHGYCLPSTIELEDLYFEWLHWPQAKLPFDDEIKKYVNEIDVESDLITLKHLGLPKENRRVYQIMTTFLKKCVQNGLTLYDIGVMICRNDSDNTTPSTLEKIYSIAKKRPKAKMMRCMSRLMDDAIHDYINQGK
jgi:hypothetical protein